MKDDLRTLCILILFTTTFVAMCVYSQEMLNPQPEDVTEFRTMVVIPGQSNVEATTFLADLHSK